jgi:hypothetical protein
MAVTQVTGAFNLGGGNSGVFTQSGPPTPTANISSATAINEGAALSFTVTTTGIADLTTLYWCVIPGTASLTDFTEVTGFFQIVGGVGSFSVTPTSELAASGSTTFAVAVKLNNPIYGETIGTSNSIIKNDTNAIAFSSIPTSIDEGSSGTFYVATTGVANSTTLYWKIPNTTDFATTTGSFVISANVGSFAVTPQADSLTEGAETFTVELRSGTVTGPVVATSSPVTINDTSLGGPSETYAFTTTPGSVNEGSAATFIITTTGVTNGTTLYWTVQTNAGDFATSSGSFTVTSNSGTFNVTPTADSTTEGAETFTVAVRTVSTSGTIVATSASVTINDTSVAATPFGVTYIVLAGGGGGPPLGNDSGGGGAGGYRTNGPPGNLSGGPAGTLEGAMTLAPATNYPVTVGAGGNNSSGGPSTFNGITSTGGGRGGGGPPGASASPGGSGGGGSPASGGSGTAGQGHPGGTYSTDAGGGGGAGAAGEPGIPSSPTKGNGGAGRQTTIYDIPNYFVGGGGGGGHDNAGPNLVGLGGNGGGGQGGRSTAGPGGGLAGIPGVSTTGGGGGGVGNGINTGGTGGPGVVVLRYPNARTCVVGPGLTAPGAFTNLAVTGSQKITEITGGTGTVSFT